MDIITKNEILFLKFLVLIFLDKLIDEGINNNKAIALYPPYLNEG